MDLSDTIIPRSDQLNAEDLLTGPHTVTVSDVRKGSAEQPVDIHLVEFPGRPFKPSKTVRRILVAAWGSDANNYPGRRMTLYRDPTVKFGGMDVGGIRVSHLSHIDKPMTLALSVTRGRRAAYVVHPLADAPPPPSARPTPPARPAPNASDEPASQRQLTAINAALGALYGFTDREDKLAYLSGEFGREFTSSKELTKDEASRLIDRLNRAQAEEDAAAEALAGQQSEDGQR